MSPLSYSSYDLLLHFSAFLTSFSSPFNSFRPIPPSSTRIPILFSLLSIFRSCGISKTSAVRFYYVVPAVRVTAESVIHRSSSKLNLPRYFSATISADVTRSVPSFWVMYKPWRYMCLASSAFVSFLTERTTSRLLWHHSSTNLYG